MQHSVLPKLHTEHETRKYGKFQLKPLARGYGTTLGVSLRRVLLSSLEGAAITAVRIQDIYHEFSAIPNLREDTTQLILNLREIELKSHAARPTPLTLHVQRPGIYTAADIMVSHDVEVLNPEHYLLTADSATDLEIDLIVEQGYGFSRQEERNNTPPGFLPIDAMFSPIVNVAFMVEDHRVGQQTDLDQVSLEIWTDGSIHPSEAMQTAADILIRHLRVVSADTPEVLEPVVEEVEPMPNAVFESSVEDLDLNVRTYNCLKRVGIATVGELVRMMEKGREEMLAIRNFGEKSLDELVTQLRKKDMLRLPGVNLDEYLEPEDAEESAEESAETAGVEAEAADADPAPVPSVSEPEAA